MPDTIRTERLLLRPLRTGDAEALYALMANWEVIRWLGTPPWPYARADAESFLALQLSLPAAPTGFLALTLDGAVIGGVSAGNAANGGRLAPRTPDLGYWLGQPYWGRGFMTEAVRAYVGRIFATMTVDTIYSGAFVGNDASLRVLDKLGFKRTRDSLVFCRPHGARLPHADMQLSRMQFLAGPP